jgi:hypothetical protein
LLLPGAMDGVKQSVCGIEFIDCVWKMAFGGKVAEIENPDDAAVENCGTGEAVPWLLCPCHAQFGSPFKGSMPILSALSCYIFQQLLLLVNAQHCTPQLFSFVFV